MLNFLAKRRLQVVIPSIIVVIAVLATAVAGIASYVIGRDALNREATGKLVALAEARRSALSDYLESIRQDLRIQAENPAIKTMLDQYISSWGAMGSNQQKTLQDLYINNNPNKTGEKDKTGRCRGWFLLQQIPRPLSPLDEPVTARPWLLRYLPVRYRG